MPTTSTRLCLFGASPATGNQGVNALCWSTLDGLTERAPAEIHVFQYGGDAVADVVPGSEPPVPYRVEPMSTGRRIWRSDHLSRALCAGRFNSSRNSMVNTVLRANAVLDVSGGDSFTDLYGRARFKSVLAPKQLALTLGRPLILLPQTYGPFESVRNERLAADIVSRATLAYARDPDSFEALQQLLGDRFDPRRHRHGVDLAFGLRTNAPAALESGVQNTLARRASEPLIVLNVSGLLSNNAAAARARFKLRADYRALVSSIVATLLESTDARILLLPHVHAPNGHFESDCDACLSVAESLPERLRMSAADRLTTLTQPLDASELKWIIGHADWVCGTRMHATIAALSQGVPACALAYSLKTRGVFERCGIGESVVDLRSENMETARERVLLSWHNRAVLKEKLSARLPDVMAQSRRQLDEILNALQLREAA